MSARSDRPAGSAPPGADARLPRIPLNLRLLVVSEDFGASAGAESVGADIARGLRRGGLPQPDLLPLPATTTTPEGLRAVFDELDLHPRMLAARALVIAAARLEQQRLAGSAAFELATRARQGGVPAYAVAGESTLDPFQARILDLQLILVASGARALAIAGRRLAREVLAGVPGGGAAGTSAGGPPNAGSRGTRR